MCVGVWVKSRLTNNLSIKHVNRKLQQAYTSGAADHYYSPITNNGSALIIDGLFKRI